MRSYIYSLMTDRAKGPLTKPLKGILYALSLVYGAAIFLRGIFYKAHIFKQTRVPMKVVSVGNLTLGGTGKTPFTIMLAELIRQEMRREVCVLIRGYGWDEQAMLKANLADTPVLVGEDRAKMARRAIRLYGSSIAVLDDGFQHWEMARDLDIVLIDSRYPFGNGHLFPRGILREGLGAIRRAGVAVFTKVDKSSGIGTSELRAKLSSFSRDLVFVEAEHAPHQLYDFRKRIRHDLGIIKGKRVFLISSIGDPSYFEDTVRGLGANVVEHLIFPDHHDFTTKDHDRIIGRCNERAFDMIVTTEKDSVKISRLAMSFGKYQIYALLIKMNILSGKEEFVARLNSVLRS